MKPTNVIHATRAKKQIEMIHALEQRFAHFSYPVYLFGSFATGNFHGYSDIDLLILVSRQQARQAYNEACDKLAGFKTPYDILTCQSVDELDNTIKSALYPIHNPQQVKAPLKRQRGMTLTEILIAMTLGAFLLGGVIQIFVNTKQTYRMQEGLSRVQENGRFAMEFLTNDIRMADFWGCGGSAKLESKLNTSATYSPFGTGIEGANDDNGGNDHDANNDENTNNIWDGTDTITLRGASGGGIYLESQPTNNSSDLKVTVNSGLNALDIVVLSNCVSGDLFQITNISTSGGFDNVIHNTGATVPGNRSNNLETGPEAAASGPHSNLYGKDAQIFKLNFVTYKIMAGASGQPALFKSTNGAAFQELVEGIEDMQILYGADTNGDGTPNTYLAAGTAGLNMNQVISIRVSLLARTIDDNIASQATDYTYNLTTTTPTDHRLRRVFTSTIAVRNRLK